MWNKVKKMILCYWVVFLVLHSTCWFFQSPPYFSMIHFIIHFWFNTIVLLKSISTLDYDWTRPSSKFVYMLKIKQQTTSRSAEEDYPLLYSDVRVIPDTCLHQLPTPQPLTYNVQTLSKWIWTQELISKGRMKLYSMVL